MVLAGVGVEHKRLVDIAQKYFVEKKPIWETHEELVTSNQNVAVDGSVAQYTGGLVQVLFKSSIEIYASLIFV